MEPVGKRVLTWVLCCVSVLGLLLGSTWLHQSVSVYVVSAGPVLDVTGAVSGAVADPYVGDTRRGGFMALTVRMRPAHRWETFSPWHNQEMVRPQPAAASGLSRSGEMAVSKAVATLVASQLLGPQAAGSRGAEVVWVHPRSPLKKYDVSTGDVVVGVEIPSFVEIGTSQDLVAALGKVEEGTVSLVLLRDTERFVVEVTAHETAALGLVVRDAVNWVLDGVEIDMGQVTGSSAGLMMVLTLLDASSPGDLSGGLEVAGTGVVDLDGRVSEVSGLRTKVASALAAGADVVFYPQGMDPEATEPYAADLVPVGSVGEAVQWLCLHGATDELCSETVRVP